MKSRKLLDSFIRYCEDNPSQRFWQALLNWSDYSFIYGSRDTRIIATAQDPDEHKVQFEDTFYKE